MVVVAGFEGAEVRAAQGLGDDVDVEDRSLLLDHGQAGAVNGDAGALFQVPGDAGVVDREAPLPGLDDLGDSANDPGEHNR